METSHGESNHATKQATINGLAVVGFIALILGGILLAIYAAKLVPGTIARLSGAVYLSEDQNNDTNATSTPEAPVITRPETPAPTTPTTNQPTTPTTRPSTGTTYRPALYGSPDLAVDVLAIGYMRSASTNSFVTASRVPEDERPAIRFRVSNIGTNATYGGFQIEVEYPSADGEDTYTINVVGTMNPGSFRDFTFGFDNPDTGNDREFRIMADSNRRIAESNESNNTDSAEIDVRGDSDDDDDNDDLSCELRISPSRIDEGESATLRWEIDGADEARINQGVGEVDEDGGSERVSPDEDTTYRLTVENDDDSTTCSVTLRVDED